MCVSTGSNYGDSIEMVFNDQRIFIDTRGQVIPPGFRIEHTIGKQFQSELEAEAVAAIG